MYQILVNDTAIAYVSEPRYVYMQDNGAWGRCEKEQAEAIAVNGELYNLGSLNKVEDRPIAQVIETDVNEIVFNQGIKLEQAEENAETVIARQEEQDDRTSALEEALTEVYEMMLL